MSNADALTILDPAPIPEEAIDVIFPVVDILTPNQHEAERLLNRTILNSEQAVQGAIALVKRGGFKAVIITMGEQGVAYSENGTDGDWLPAFQVDTIDTVAAGDCFNGALAASIVNGVSFRESVVFAMAAAALSVTKEGASSSVPSLIAVQEFLENHKQPGSTS